MALSKRPLNSLRFSELTAGGYAARLRVQCSDRKLGVWDLLVDGYWVCNFRAGDRTAALRIMRGAFRNYQSSAYVQSLYFNGHLEPDEISTLEMAVACLHKIEGIAK